MVAILVVDNAARANEQDPVMNVRVTGNVEQVRYLMPTKDRSVYLATTPVLLPDAGPMKA